MSEEEAKEDSEGIAEAGEEADMTAQEAVSHSQQIVELNIALSILFNPPLEEEVKFRENCEGDDQPINERKFRLSRSRQMPM